MSDYTIKIQNCNNIALGELPIYSNKLNIMFGRNGTGKSTMVRAIALTSQQQALTELAPYGISTEDVQPHIEGFSSDIIAIFDEDYVRQYVYQTNTLIKNTFEVLIRSNEYDNACGRARCCDLVGGNPTWKGLS